MNDYFNRYTHNVVYISLGIGVMNPSSTLRKHANKQTIHRVNVLIIALRHEQCAIAQRDNHVVHDSQLV